MHLPVLAALSILAAAPVSPTAPDPDAPATPPAAPDLRLPSAGMGSVILPAVALAALAGAALVLRRRRLSPQRRIQVLETTSLGPKRSLVLARLGDELLLLGSSEAGIHLLRAGPAEPDPPAAAPPPARAPARIAPEPSPAVSGLMARLRGARPRPAATQPFDALLSESLEDQELRRKLAGGQRGSVR